MKLKMMLTHQSDNSHDIHPHHHHHHHHQQQQQQHQPQQTYHHHHPRLIRSNLLSSSPSSDSSSSCPSSSVPSYDHLHTPYSSSSRLKRPRLMDTEHEVSEDEETARGGDQVIAEHRHKRGRSSMYLLGSSSRSDEMLLDHEPIVDRSTRMEIMMINEEGEEQEDEDDRVLNHRSGSFQSSSSSSSSNFPHQFQSTSSQSSNSPLLPKTPDLIQAPNFSWPIDSHDALLQSGWDEIELLTAIEKQAETYSVETGYDDHHQAFFDSIHPSSSQPSSYDPRSASLAPSSLTHRQVIPDGPRPPPSHQEMDPISPSSLVTPTGHHRSQLGLDRHLLISSVPQEIKENHHTTPTKPYKCSMCPKSFTRNYDLTRHKSSHQDQRQHSCSKCGRSFNRRDALIRHGMVKGCGTSHNITPTTTSSSQ